MPVINRLADRADEIAEWRHDLHMHPELQYDVHRTAASVADRLKSFGCDEIVTGIGRPGVVGAHHDRPIGLDGEAHERLLESLPRAVVLEVVARM